MGEEPYLRGQQEVITQNRSLKVKIIHEIDLKGRDCKEGGQRSVKEVIVIQTGHEERKVMRSKRIG